MSMIMAVLEYVWRRVYRATGAAALDRWLADRRAGEYTDLARSAAEAGVGPDSVATLHQLAAREQDRIH